MLQHPNAGFTSWADESVGVARWIGRGAILPKVRRSLKKHGDSFQFRFNVKQSRHVPIEPNLLPLLKVMHREAGGKGPILTIPIKKAADELRMHLKRAGVTRSDPFASDITRKPMTFHDLRATGVTWMAIRGDEPLKIMQRAGHADFDTTQIYLREAETIGRDVGVPFPELPEDLESLPEPLGSGSSGGQVLETLKEILAGWTGLEIVRSNAVWRRMVTFRQGLKRFRSRGAMPRNVSW